MPKRSGDFSDKPFPDFDGSTTSLDARLCVFVAFIIRVRFLLMGTCLVSVQVIGDDFKVS